MNTQNLQRRFLSSMKRIVPLLSARNEGDPGDGDVRFRVQQVGEGMYDVVTEFPPTGGPLDDVVVTGHIGMPVEWTDNPVVGVQLTSEAFGRPAEMTFEEPPLSAFRVLLRFFRSKDAPYAGLCDPNPDRPIHRLCRRVIRRNFGQPPTPKVAGMDLDLLLAALCEERSPLDERILFGEVVKFLVGARHLNPKEGLDALEELTARAAQDEDGYSGQHLRRWIDRQMAERVPA